MPADDWCAKARLLDVHLRAVTYKESLAVLSRQDGTEVVVPQAAAAKAGAKSAAAATDVRLDTEWIAEHASQVTRMLPGGETTSN